MILAIFLSYRRVARCGKFYCQVATDKYFPWFLVKGVRASHRCIITQYVREEIARNRERKRKRENDCALITSSSIFLFGNFYSSRPRKRFVARKCLVCLFVCLFDCTQSLFVLYIDVYVRSYYIFTIFLHALYKCIECNVRRRVKHAKAKYKSSNTRACFKINP